MKVINTYIVWKDNRYLTLHETNDGWFADCYNIRGDYMYMHHISNTEAKKLIENTKQN